jgi:hypothetical protein
MPLLNALSETYKTTLDKNQILMFKILEIKLNNNFKKLR